jgi:methionine-rich copper-binding protein CopC
MSANGMMRRGCHDLGRKYPVRERSSALVALLLATCFSLAAAAPAWAHAKLVESEPAGGSVLGEAPEQVRLHFDEPVRFEESSESEPSPLDPIQVYSEEGTRVDRNNTRVDAEHPKVLVVDLKELPDGVYGVDWTVTSEDGHVVDGALGFTVDSSRPTGESAADPQAKDDEGSSLDTTLVASLAVLTVCVVGLGVFGALRRR